MENLTKEDIRQIVREELERVLMVLLDAKTTATAIEKGLFYSDGSPSTSHNKPLPHK